MKKIQLLFFIFCVFYFQMAEAQKSIDVPGLSKVLPPAPNAFELTKYSGLPINKSFGSVSAAIPLGEITQGKVSLPISLSYNSGNGVKVNQIASRVGIGWVLNAGGVITRSVSGLPDEKSTFPPQPTNIGADSPDLFNYLEQISLKTTYDSAPDLFSFNFNGYSGKFILNPADRTKVIFLSPLPLKVVTNLNHEYSGDWSIKITDPKGISYFFGGTTATENSKTEPSGCGKSFEEYIPTAWYLINIEEHGVKQIEFQYSPINFEYLADISQTMIRTPISTYSDFFSPDLPFEFRDSILAPGPQPCQIKSENNVCATRLRSNGVLLNSITSRISIINFNYTSRSDVVGDYLVSSVTFSKQDLNGLYTIYDSYSLNYTNGVNNLSIPPIGGPSIRPFLTSVCRTISAPNECHFIKYNNIDKLPARLSFSQDYWGYFNDRNNSFLLPKSDDVAMIAPVFPETMANREPNGAVANYGLLCSIVYPTGGKDSIEYEPNTIYEGRVVMPPRSSLSNSIQGTGKSGINSFSYPIQCASSHSLKLTMSSVYSGSGVLDSIHQLSIFKLYAPNQVLVYEKVVKIGASYTATIPVSSGNYNLVVSAYGEADIARVYVDYQPPGSFITGNFEVGGVRVSRTQSISTTGPPINKTYVYASLEHQNQSSGRIQETPSPDMYYEFTPIYSGDSFKQCMYITAYSSPKRSLEYSSGSHIFYTDVIELNNDLWQNGGTAYKYIGNNSSNAQTLRGNTISGLAATNIGFDIGLETKVIVFSTIGGFLGDYQTRVINEKRTHYVIDERLASKTRALAVRKKYPFLDLSPNAFILGLKAYDVSEYNYYSVWIHPDSVVTTNYDAQGENPIVSKEILTYNNTEHLQPTEIRVSMSDGRTKSMVLQYPHDMVTNGVVYPYSAMIENNIVDVPIVKTESINGTFVQQLTNNYANWGNGIFSPQTIQYRVGTGTNTTYIRFHGFDADGNLLSQSLEDGSNISYKYGYKNTRLIAEVKNALPEEFYFENFEDSPSGVVGPAHTGTRYTTNPNVNWTPPNGKKYNICYWYRYGSVWYYSSSQTYTGPNFTMTGGNAFDDIVISPSISQVTTYTYKPLVGIASQTDAKGMTTYYDYDSFGRLTNLRDQNGNIVKNYRYNYAGLSYPSAALSGSFTKNDCPSGQQGTAVAYSLSAGAYTGSTQAEADAAAWIAFQSGGQANANAQGTCVSANFRMSYSLPWNRSFMASFYNVGTGTVQYRFLSGSGELSDLPQGSYYVSLNETGYNGIYQVYLDWSMQQGTYVSYGPLQLSGQHSLYVQELSFSAPLYQHGTYMIDYNVIY